MLQSWQSREIEIDRDVFLIFTPEGPFYIKLSTTTTYYSTGNGLQRFSLSPSPFLPFSFQTFIFSPVLSYSAPKLTLTGTLRPATSNSNSFSLINFFQ